MKHNCHINAKLSNYTARPLSRKVKLHTGGCSRCPLKFENSVVEGLCALCPHYPSIFSSTMSILRAEMVSYLQCSGMVSKRNRCKVTVNVYVVKQTVGDLLGRASIKIRVCYCLFLSKKSSVQCGLKGCNLLHQL